MVAAHKYLLTHLLISAAIAFAWVRADLRPMSLWRVAASFWTVFIGWPLFLAATSAILIADAVPRRAADRLAQASHGTGPSDTARAATTL